jgi:AmiR/NasT family two-component response regulator
MHAYQAGMHAKNDPPTALLVVDDDALITATIGSTLREAGYEVFEASDAERALELCASRRMDLAILDNQLPSLSGPQLALMLREQHALHSIFLSAYDNSELVQQAIDAGAISYLLKPIDPLELIPAVRAALSRATELRTLAEREGQLKDSLTASRDINTAVGVLMERLNIRQEHAFACLRRYARTQRRRIVDVARDLLHPLNQAHDIASQIAAHAASYEGGADDHHKRRS